MKMETLTSNLSCTASAGSLWIAHSILAGETHGHTGRYQPGPHVLVRARAEDYRVKAQECVERAKRAPDHNSKEVYEELARQWLDLAKQAETSRILRSISATATIATTSSATEMTAVQSGNMRHRCSRETCELPHHLTQLQQMAARGNGA